LTELISECRILEEDVTVHLFMAESMQALHTGKNPCGILQLQSNGQY